MFSTAYVSGERLRRSPHVRNHRVAECPRPRRQRNGAPGSPTRYLGDAMRFALVGVAILSALVVAACGGDADGEPTPSEEKPTLSEEQQARAAVERFAAAWEAGDGAKACSLVHPREARHFNVPCARYFSKTSGAFRGLRVRGAFVERNVGVVNVTWSNRPNGQRRLAVEQVGGEWLVAFGRPPLIRSSAPS